MYSVELQKEYSQKCRSILEEPEIRFCGFIDGNGELVTGGFRDDVVPFEDDENRKKMFQELAYRVANRKEFDSNLGRVKYSASRRDKVVMMSFPVGGNILMITAEPNVNIDRLAYRIIKKLGREWSEFYGL